MVVIKKIWWDMWWGEMILLMDGKVWYDMIWHDCHHLIPLTTPSTFTKLVQFINLIILLKKKKSISLVDSIMYRHVYMAEIIKSHPSTYQFLTISWRVTLWLAKTRKIHITPSHKGFSSLHSALFLFHFPFKSQQLLCKKKKKWIIRYQKDCY